MTRARERLYLSHANIRRIWGQFSYQYPSSFFTEIPKKFITVRDFAGSRKTATTPMQPSFSPSFRVVEAAPAPDAAYMGKRFDHPDYGYGRIVGAEGSGEALKVLVEFKDRSKRKFLFRYVKTFLED